MHNAEHEFMPNTQNVLSTPSAPSAHEQYSQLLETLRLDGRAAVVSRYGENGFIDRHVVSAGDPDAWSELESFLAQPNVVASGPVASSIAEEGSLTLVETYSSKPRLVILGGGHIASALVPIAKLVDFEVLVYDDRLAFANAERFPQADTIICDGFDRLSERVDFRKTDYLVVVTRGHRHDSDCLKAVLAVPESAYTGMIGSKRRVAIVMEQLRSAGFDEQRISRIHAPIGLRIGAFTPAEIAISIISEIIAVRRLERVDTAYASCDLEVVKALAVSGSGMEAMLTIYNTEGSVPIEVGAKMAMDYGGNIVGTIGGGCSEAEAMQVARDVIRSGGWRTHIVDMTDSAEEDGMVCGGTMRVVIERL
jgi:xanthine dehydrogenase accessory factor